MSYLNIISHTYRKLNRSTKKGIFGIVDILIFSISIYLAFSLRFDLFEAWNQIHLFYQLVLIIYPIKLISFWLVGVYRPVLRYAGVEFLYTALIAAVGSSGIVALSGFILLFPLFPRSVFILDSLLTLILVVASRILVRWIIYRALVDPEEGGIRERIIIYGAGEAGSQLLQALSRDRSYQVKGFVDDNPQLANQIISGSRVYSPRKLADLVRKNKVDTVLLAMPSAGMHRNKEIVGRVQHFGVQIKTVPGLSEIVSGKVSINEIRKIDIADLLGREEVQPDPDLLEKNIQGKSVLVTGAGGSIGSELCRQIVQLEPERLVLYERNEFALYNIDLELREHYPNMELASCLASTTSSARLELVLSEYSVQTIYHAAAYKHVPLMESNLSEGVLNNVQGTLVCVEAAEKCGVETFVLVSTDKAVRPANMMGVTKRISELILQAFSQKEGIATRFMMVRFGNVLDSKGSVVPLFRQQLSEGRNLTLTHEDITRYFMSIPEAVRLIIQAGALGEGGEVFFLDMGDPVKIYDLAKQMIELSGLSLGRDIDIDIIGLRPGEKLYEELLIDSERSLPTEHPKIFSAREESLPLETLKELLENLLEAAINQNDDQVMATARNLVPEFRQKGT
jgi:FlaA1/EpsC-like NDP-sugar epimerase